ncbi:nitroreductase family protein [Dermatophilaceae bacterium Soc4.6]
MAEHVLDATAMARAVLSDPQFSFPAMPRTVPGLVTVTTPTGVIVDGGPSRQAFQGASATHLPRVMGLLDGTRDVDAVATAAGLARAEAWTILSLLYSTGLVEEARGDAAVDHDDPTACFLSRSIDTTRVNRNGTEALDRLRRSVVGVVSTDAPWAELVARLLEAESVGSVWVEDRVRDDRPAGDLLLVVGDGPEAEAAALSARGSSSVLPIHVDGAAVHAGPVLDGAHTTCASCAMRQRRTLLAPEAPEASTPGSADRELAALLVVRDVVALLSRVGTTAASRFVVTTRLDDLVQTARVVVPHPSCPVCMDPSASDGDGGLPLGWAYTHSVAFPPRDGLNPKDHQVHYQSGNIALQRRHRVWPASPRVALPAREVDAGHPVRLDVVGDLLVRTVGLRNGPSGSSSRVDRWCATGGNLGSPSAYLVARRVDGLRPGVYGFQSQDASLALLPWADPETALAGVPDVPAVVVLTGGLDTVATKYGAFAWRILHLDAGAAMAQAHALAVAAGLRLLAVPVWDDAALAELLASDPDAEPVTAVFGVLEKGPVR